MRRFDDDDDDDDDDGEGGDGLSKKEARESAQRMAAAGVEQAVY